MVINSQNREHVVRDSTGKLGEGGMAAGYRATDTGLDRDAAIKA